jgi:hypothetical protein
LSVSMVACSPPELFAVSLDSLDGAELHPAVLTSSHDRMTTGSE